MLFFLTMTMTDIEAKLNRIARDHPARPAICFKDHQLTYRELTERLGALGNALGDLRGARVLVLLPDGLPAYLIHLLGFLGRAVIVPQTVQTVTSRIQSICDLIKPDLVVTHQLLYKGHAGALEHQPCVLVPPNVPDGTFDLTPAGTPPTLPRPTRCATDEDDVRVILFTSGTTGTPKGVCLAEHNILAAARMMVTFLHLQSDRKTLVSVPLYDYYGCIQIYAHVLAETGFTFGLSSAFPESLVNHLRRHQATDLALVPYSLRKLLDYVEHRDPQGLRPLRYMTSSSDHLTEDILSRVFSAHPTLTLYNIYGLTEAGRASYRVIRADTPFAPSIGIPSPGVTIRIDGTRERPGELVIEGPNVMKGYLREVRDGRLSIIPFDRIHTGDYGYWDERGEIILEGRKDHMINMMGVKIHPSEVESVALCFPGITDARAYTGASPSGDPVMHLDVVCETGLESGEPFHVHLQRNLPRLFVPTSIRLVKTIQRTEVGAKVIR